jgi:hypothetical protein
MYVVGLNGGENTWAPKAETNATVYKLDGMIRVTVIDGVDTVKEVDV